jgi:NAD(P)-dependent dehydrogenase (short-subunit alcohol dehydrogenase family)
VSRAAAHFGGIDVLVNNAGYGMFGTIEEASEDEARAQFEANFFGPVHQL